MKRFVKKGLGKFTSYLPRSLNGRWSAYFFHPKIWAINRRAVSRGVAIGLFFCCIPLPLQMLLSGIAAYWFRGNFPIAILVTWVNNPFTFVPLNLAIYNMGNWVLRYSGTSQSVTTFQPSSMHLSDIFFNIGPWIKELGLSYLVGLPIISIILSITGYILVDLLWRIDIYWKCYQRKLRRKKHTPNISP